MIFIPYTTDCVQSRILDLSSDEDNVTNIDDNNDMDPHVYREL